MITRFLLCCLLALLGVNCATRKPPAVQSKPQTLAFWKPYLLYLKPTPHDRMHVEVDAVAGCEPAMKELESLGAFLGAHCEKPGGIEIRKSSVIPRSEARGLSRRELARQWMNGPPTEGREPAYLYVLYYDGRLGGRGKAAGANPHTELLPYPAAIFINRGYRPLLAPWMKDALVRHEAGHVLGLAQREERAKGGHCTEKECLMSANLKIHILRLLTGRDPVTQKQLCQHCLRQLEQASKLPPKKNLSFGGPVLVREEQGYRVLSLQGSLALVIGGGREEAVAHFRQRERTRKTEAGQEPDTLFYYAWIAEGMRKESDEVQAILDRASRDPFGMVRDAAKELGD